MMWKIQVRLCAWFIFYFADAADQEGQSSLFEGFEGCHGHQKPDQHRLMQHVPTQAPASEPGQRRGSHRQGPAHLGRMIFQLPLPGRHAPPYDPEPGQQRDVILGDGFAADQPQPVECRIIEKAGTSSIKMVGRSYEFHSNCGPAG